MKVERYYSTSGEDVIYVYLRKQSPRTRAKCLATINALKHYGLELHPKFLRKMTGRSNLWELRIRTSVQSRILFSITAKGVAVLLHAFTKKTQKTPPTDIAVALQRQKKL